MTKELNNWTKSYYKVVDKWVSSYIDFMDIYSKTVQEAIEDKEENETILIQEELEIKYHHSNFFHLVEFHDEDCGCFRIRVWKRTDKSL